MEKSDDEKINSRPQEDYEKTNGLSATDDTKLVSETKVICGYIKNAIGIANFWEKDDEISSLYGKIASRLRLGALKGLIVDKDELTAQIISICKNNYAELVRRLDDLA